MLQMVASGRGVAALPRWLAENTAKSSLISSQTREKWYFSQIHLGRRGADEHVDYLTAFIDQQPVTSNPRS